MHPLFISFATPSYAAETAGLVETLREFGLEHHVASVPSFGSWVANCAFKATFIRDQLLQHSGRGVVWVDADARIRRYPELFDNLEGFDLAAHWKGGIELLSGTLYVGPGAEAFSLVEAWIEKCSLWPSKWDQVVLAEVLRRRPSVKVLRLPPSYVAIFDAEMCPEHEQVITHYQASRRLATSRA